MARRIIHPDKFEIRFTPNPDLAAAILAEMQRTRLPANRIAETALAMHLAEKQAVVSITPISGHAAQEN